MKSFHEVLNFLEAQAFVMTLYHGTGVENVKNIVLNKQGLKMDRPRTTSGLGTEAVYLTPNIELAARYSTGGLSKAPLDRDPAILEIKIHKARRYNKMQVDPLDSSASAWQNHYDDDGYSDDDDQEFFRAMKETVAYVNRVFGTEMSIDRFDKDIEHWQGYDLHGSIRQAVAKKLGKDFNRLKPKLAEILRKSSISGGSHFGKIEITDSGTVRLTGDFWSDAHQTLYKNFIPYNAIKAVWVKKSKHPDIHGEEKEIGEEMLPAEVVHEFENAKRFLMDLADEVRKLAEDIIEDKEYCEEEFESIIDKLDKMGYDDLSEKVEEIKSLALAEEDYESQLEKLDDRAREFEGYLNDEYMPGKTSYAGKEIWVKIDSTNISELNKLR